VCLSAEARPPPEIFFEKFDRPAVEAVLIRG
jgi:hypothetical protein